MMSEFLIFILVCIHIGCTSFLPSTSPVSKVVVCLAELERL